MAMLAVASHRQPEELRCLVSRDLAPVGPDVREAAGKARGASGPNSGSGTGPDLASAPIWAEWAPWG